MKAGQLEQIAARLMEAVRLVRNQELIANSGVQAEKFYDAMGLAVEDGWRSWMGKDCLPVGLLLEPSGIEIHENAPETLVPTFS